MLGILIGLLVLLAFLFLVVIVGSAIAFSGSTGSAHGRFADSLSPLYGFCIGAYAAAAAVAIVNAVVMPEGFWARTTAAAAVVGGVVAAASPAVAGFLMKGFIHVIGLMAKVFLQQ